MLASSRNQTSLSLAANNTTAILQPKSFGRSACCVPRTNAFITVPERNHGLAKKSRFLPRQTAVSMDHPHRPGKRLLLAHLTRNPWSIDN